MASNPHVPLNIESEEFKLLECFCVIIYDKTSNLEYVNEARRELFCQKNRTMETIPPTQDAFLQHCRRAAYRLAFGAQVTELIRSCQVQKDMAGH